MKSVRIEMRSTPSHRHAATSMHSVVVAPRRCKGWELVAGHVVTLALKYHALPKPGTSYAGRGGDPPAEGREIWGPDQGGLRSTVQSTRTHLGPDAQRCIQHPAA